MEWRRWVAGVVDRSVDDPTLGRMRRDNDAEAVAIESYYKSNPRLHMVQPPASKLRLKEEVKIVLYLVDRRDWRNAIEGHRA